MLKSSYGDKMIIAVDFDGTLCQEAYPEIGEPIQETIDLVRHLHSLGDTIILYTCRTDKYLTEAVEWCKQHKIPIDYVNENVPEKAKRYGADCRKISADIYIEDRSINFSTKLSHIEEYLTHKKETTMLKTDGMNKVNNSTPLLCTDCIHKAVCKYIEILHEQENNVRVKGGEDSIFKLTCKYHETNNITFNYPYAQPCINYTDTATKYCKYAKGYCQWNHNGICDAPNNIAGLPCQNQLTAVSTTDKTKQLGISTVARQTAQNVSATCHAKS